MFEKLKKAVKSMVQRFGAETELGRIYESVFDIDGVPPFNQFYSEGIFIWKNLYRGFYALWHRVPAPTIENEKNKRDLLHLNISKAICSEVAGLVWNDRADITVSTDGLNLEEGQTDPLDDFVQSVLKDNSFDTAMLTAIEQATALGGEALKVWYEERHDSNGNPVEGSGRINIGFSQADQFVPTAWNNKEVTEGMFIQRTAKDGYYYTRVEWHRWDGNTYYITNSLFRADMETNSGEQDILGYEYPLAFLYPYLEPETVVDVGKSLFSYFRTPTANNLDDNSPLGVSIYGNALDTLHALDICFDSFVREFRLGKKRIIVPARMVKKVVDPQTGQTRRYFDASDEVYEAFSSDDPDSMNIVDNSVVLRVEEHVSAMNAFLNILCLQIGLSAGTFSFDRDGGLRTATEIVSENSKTYKTVKNFQNNIVPAVERLIENIINVAMLYDVQWEGRSVSELASAGWNINVTLDDGVVQDRQTNIDEGIKLMQAGVLSRKTFMTDPKYGLGYTDESAEDEIEQISKERNVGADNIEIFERENLE